MKISNKLFSIVLFSSLLGSLSSCGETQFTGREANARKVTPKVAPNPIKPVLALNEHELKMPCRASGETVQKNISGSLGDKLVINGEICHTADSVSVTNKLSVAFVLDFSGSMEDNDPEIGGTCGRQKAVDAIINQLKANATVGTEIEIGVVGFDGDALEIVELQSVGSFRQEWGEDFCQANGFTNYEDAFNSAGEMLSTNSGRKAVYFISDGLPTASSGELEQADELGLAAAKNLRASSDVTLYTIYLDGAGGIPVSQYSDIVDPKAYLAEISGSADNVKVVSSADQLAQEIVKFKIPDPTNATLANPRGILAASGFGTQELIFASFAPHPSKANTWSFSTQPIKLNYNLGKAAQNQFTISATTDQGREKSIQGIVNFTVSE